MIEQAIAFIVLLGVCMFAAFVLIGAAWIVILLLVTVASFIRERGTDERFDEEREGYRS